MRNYLFLVEEMSQGLNLVCQPPLTIAVTVPSIQERYALAPTVRAQLMAGNSSSWDIADNHTGLPTGINLQAPSSSNEEPYPIKLSTDGSVMHVRMLLSSRDAGSIIGKAGTAIKTIREESGAKINISDGTTTERMVTVVGTIQNIYKAFLYIGKKLETDYQDSQLGYTGLITFRLCVPATQCGSLIGKGGSKIRELRESTGASVQVAGETLPGSNERAVTISGGPESLAHCVTQICEIIFETPPKGPLMPYRPGAVTRVNSSYSYQQGPYAAAAAAQVSHQAPTTTQQMRIPNDLIGCVIGKKGAKIHEIRMMSGANIKIANNEGDMIDRLVTITGTPEAVSLAQYLINSRSECYASLLV